MTRKKAPVPAVAGAGAAMAAGVGFAQRITESPLQAGDVIVLGARASVQFTFHS